MPHNAVYSTSIDLHSQKLFVTLEPLRNEGQDALRPGGSIRHARLRELESYWRNAPDDITIRKADDLFARAEEVGDAYGPVQPKAMLARATLDLDIEGVERPHRVSLRPPHTVTFESPADASQVLAWLEERSYVKRDA